MNTALQIGQIDEDDRVNFLNHDTKGLISAINLSPKNRAQFNHARGNIFDLLRLGGIIDEKPLLTDAHDQMCTQQNLGFNQQVIPGVTIDRTPNKWEKSLMLCFIQRSLKKMKCIEEFRIQTICDIRDNIDDELSSPKRDEKKLQRLRNLIGRMMSKTDRVLSKLKMDTPENELERAGQTSIFDMTFLQEYLSHETKVQGFDLFSMPSFRQLSLSDNFKTGITEVLGISDESIDEAIDSIRNRDERIAPDIDQLMNQIRPYTPKIIEY